MGVTVWGLRLLGFLYWLTRINSIMKLFMMVPRQILAPQYALVGERGLGSCQKHLASWTYHLMPAGGSRRSHERTVFPKHRCSAWPLWGRLWGKHRSSLILKTWPSSANGSLQRHRLIPNMPTPFWFMLKGAPSMKIPFLRVYSLVIVIEVCKNLDTSIVHYNVNLKHYTYSSILK